MVIRLCDSLWLSDAAARWQPLHPSRSPTWSNCSQRRRYWLAHRALSAAFGPGIQRPAQVLLQSACRHGVKLNERRKARRVCALRATRSTREPYKPGSVSRHKCRDGDHPSGSPIAWTLVQPTRGPAGRRFWQVAFQTPSIRPCSGWGLASARVATSGRGLLPRDFTLTPTSRGGLFLCHFPSGFPAWDFPSTLSGGARTFLSPA